ncbi:hypothetical protein [Pedobacter gandavensis]|uniref:hypothetical protein n=1 Tax=Pedobacter gandavensis TaxID=2679963 RepID=UPI0029303C25|nr:hypothetical protein [Pedobacter gandavensis]
METTSSSTYLYKTTRGSDELGEGVLEFGSAIIWKKEVIKNPVYKPGDTPTQTTNYTINEVSSGTFILLLNPK